MTVGVSRGREQAADQPSRREPRGRCKPPHHACRGSRDDGSVGASARIRWTVEDESLDVGSGDTIITPRGIEHMFEVLGGEPAQVVGVCCPPAAKGA
jgi:quercetin dioxygenase-like cupin family protein